MSSLIEMESAANAADSSNDPGREDENDAVDPGFAYTPGEGSLGGEAEILDQYLTNI